ncbi:hypothetical protein CEXT_627121 [Caerostris extrusa]|uniref:Uncharacterized protein n=1 Tax=Caerostris extrusa TaxID=172846 RepID=A0AAV4X1G6_CAEEX|nr:hypothetical protein CEXT_627121 [Caerostris extrusa]
MAARFGNMQGSCCSYSMLALHNFLKLADDAMPPLKRRYCPPGYSDTLSRDGDTILGSWRQEECALKMVSLIGSNMHTKRILSNISAV